MIKDILEESDKEGPEVIYDTDPKKLVDRLIELIEEKKIKGRFKLLLKF